MMRLDKYLCEAGLGTRSQVKGFLKNGLVTVNGCKQTSADCKVEEMTDHITFRGQTLHYARFGYFLLNKPAGVVSATRDNLSDTVIGLVKNTGFKDLFPVGRLDKDTEGLLIVTNDGEFAHNLLSPRKHVPKTYLARIRSPLSPQSIQALENGVDIGDEAPTLPAAVTVLADDTIRLTITEGRFHQVKRMLQAVDNEVVYLKRLSMGSLTLDETLAPGCFRPLTEEEIASLCKSLKDQ